jgi:outer membrane protein insertion porin family
MLGFFCSHIPMTRIHFLACLLCFLSLPIMAQKESGEYEVAKLEFKGNVLLKTENLLGVLQTKESPMLAWKLLYKLSESVGKKPEYFDRYVFGVDLLQLKKYYRANGFYRALIDTAIEFDHEAKTASLSFIVNEGRRSYIDTLSYTGIESLPKDLSDEIIEKRLLHVGDPFVDEKLEEERRRVITTFANYGFIQIGVDTLLAIHYSSTNNIAIHMTLSPGNRFSFGSITIKSDSTVRERVEDWIILRHIDFKPGDRYNQDYKFES